MKRMYLDRIKDIAEVAVINSAGILASVSIKPMLSFLQLTNEFFHDTEYIWKSIPLIVTTIYTLWKMRNERKKSNSTEI